MPSISSRPWNLEPVPEIVHRTPGMILAAERHMLYWLCRNYVDGRGHVLDIGCFLGASTNAMASGLADNPNWPKDRKVLVLDNFVTTEGMIWLHPTELGNKKVDESFFDVFLHQTEPNAALINVEPRDILAMTSFPSPIELLFIDAAKSMALNQRITRLGFPQLTPGRSLVVQQDYIFEFCPWIIATMEYFADRFEFVDFALGSSFLYRFVGPTFSDEEMVKFSELSYADMIPLHWSARERVSRELDTIVGGTIAELPKGIIREMMKLSAVELAFLAGGKERAAETFQSFAFDDLGQEHMKSRIRRTAARVGV